MRDNPTMGNSNNAGTSSSLYSVARASESSNSLSGTNSQSPLSDDSMLTPPAVDSNRESITDLDQQYTTRLPQISCGNVNMPRYSTESVSSGFMDYAEILTEIKDLDSHEPLANDWRVDPHTVDPESTIHLTETYFTFVNDRLYYMFPRRRFLLWLKSCHTKSLDDKMLVYSIMALGCIFSDRPDRIAAMKRYSRTARYALEHNQHSLSLQLAQSQIIMSLWYHAVGALVKSWDAAGAAVRTVCGLRYNVEMGGVIVEQGQSCEYSLHPQALIECRRRTFWIAFLTDVSNVLDYARIPYLYFLLNISNYRIAFVMFLCAFNYLHLLSNSIFEASLPRRNLRGPGVHDGAVFPKLFEPDPFL